MKGERDSPSAARSPSDRLQWRVQRMGVAGRADRLHGFGEPKEFNATRGRASPASPRQRADCNTLARDVTDAAPPALCRNLAKPRPATHARTTRATRPVGEPGRRSTPRRLAVAIRQDFPLVPGVRAQRRGGTRLRNIMACDRSKIAARHLSKLLPAAYLRMSHRTSPATTRAARRVGVPPKATGPPCRPQRPAHRYRTLG